MRLEVPRGSDTAARRVRSPLRTRKSGRSPGRQRAAILLAASASLTATPAGAADPGARLLATADAGRPRTLPEISAAEVLGARDRAVSMGRWTDGSSFGMARAGSLPVTVRRELPSLWRLETGPDVDPSSMDVRYHMLGGTGRSSAFVHTADTDSLLHVRVLPLPTRVIGRDASRTVVDGGVELELDLRDATRAGRYSGTLLYTISVF